MWVLTLMVVVFIIGYFFIAIEHISKINKAAIAIFMGAILWAILALEFETVLSLGFSRVWENFKALHAHAGHIDVKHMREFVTEHELLRHLSEISSILFFLLGAMTIVETIDHFQGFRIITDKIKTTKKVKLMWIIGILTFFMSAALDNLTSTIVMVVLLRKLIADKETRWFFAGMVVVAANAGGAWSPIGDVTTIMLWIGGQLTTPGVITTLFIPSLISLLVPLVFSGFLLKGTFEQPKVKEEDQVTVPLKERVTVFIIGVGALLSVPVFKTFTHLPPFMGMLLGFGFLWIFTDRRLQKLQECESSKFCISHILRKVDVSTILFFLGILLAVGSLQTAGQLNILAEWLTEKLQNVYAINVIIGLLSSIVDNVPLVAASMNMYEIVPAAEASGFLSHFVIDGHFWQLLAYCAGTGGSILIIGSAAGVAAMGMEHINFFWYLRKIGWLAAIGYFSGVATYALMFA